MIRKIASSLLLLTIVTSFATPQQVILVPHAEKSSSGDLTPMGYQDAQMLAQWLLNQPTLKPNIIIANSTPQNRARGSIETCTPIAHDLKLPVNSQFLTQDASQLAAALLANKTYNNKTVLICWDQHSLTQVAGSLGAATLKTLPPGQGYIIQFGPKMVTTTVITPYQAES